MKKNRFFHVFSILIPVFTVFIITSCATKSYDFIGTWNHQPETLTYINYDQHVKVTFPDKRWHVFTQPTSEAMKKHWDTPTKDDPGYQIITALIKYIPIIATIRIEPTPLDVSLDDYLDIGEQDLKRTLKNITVLRKEVIERNNRSIGVILYRMIPTQGLEQKHLFVIFKEPGRFTMLVMACPELYFEFEEGQLWSIIDSYKYIE